MPPIPDWLLIILLLLGAGVLGWLVLMVITFIGIAIMPKDANDNIYYEKKDK